MIPGDGKCVHYWSNIRTSHIDTIVRQVRTDVGALAGNAHERNNET